MKLSTAAWHLFWLGLVAISHYSHVTWPLLILKSMATWLIVQQLFQTNNNENIKTHHCWSFCEGKPSVTGGPKQRTNNVESVPMSWRQEFLCAQIMPTNFRRHEIVWIPRMWYSLLSSLVVGFDGISLGAYPLIVLNVICVAIRL